MNAEEIAKQIKETKENIILTYAFNATGKTRLCVEYKNLTKNPETGDHAGVYYNAYSEDLFVWDNDEDNSNANIQLSITYSSLNQFHSFINNEVVREKLRQYHPKYNFRFNQHENPEMGIVSVSFFVDIEEEEKFIKISRGEERIFVWCFFLALFELDVWVGVQDAHYFIDDPVSSMDEHNIFITADTIYNLIEKNYLKKRIVITTHHIGLFSILADRLKRGEKSGSYKNLTKLYILSIRDNKLVLKSSSNDVFLFHLHLLQILDAAIKEQLYLYHFVLLRQVLETISSFLGTGKLNYTLTQIGVANVEVTANLINSRSHQDEYRFQFNQMPPVEEDIFKEIFTKIQTKYNFVLHAN